MGQKAKLGEYPHKAPLGYLNVREPIGGRQVAHIVPDSERASLVRTALEYAGDWTLSRLAAEMAHQGSRNRGRGHDPFKPLGVSGLGALLAHRAYVGVEWDVEYRAATSPSSIGPPLSGSKSCSTVAPCAAPASAGTIIT